MSLLALHFTPWQCPNSYTMFRMFFPLTQNHTMTWKSPFSWWCNSDTEAVNDKNFIFRPVMWPLTSWTTCQTRSGATNIIMVIQLSFSTGTYIRMHGVKMMVDMEQIWRTWHRSYPRFGVEPSTSANYVNFELSNRITCMFWPLILNHVQIMA